MKRAYCMLRENIARRHEVFVEGLRAAGYHVACGAPSSVSKGDALLIWNRRGQEEQIADAFERAGGVVVVAEEGYVRRQDFYALARRYHNGGGEELASDPARVDSLAIEPLPWRATGDHILVCPNRFIGPRSALMPADWVHRTVNHLRKITRREVRVRPHPGRVKDAMVNGRSLQEDLAGAWLCVVWWSSAGIAALLSGIPTIYCAPWWIGAAGAGHDFGSVEAPVQGDRDAMLRKIANAQFTPTEVLSGAPFKALTCH